MCGRYLEFDGRRQIEEEAAAAGELEAERDEKLRGKQMANNVNRQLAAGGESRLRKTGIKSRKSRKEVQAKNKKGAIATSLGRVDSGVAKHGSRGTEGVPPARN